ncbi:ergothioneine biosynthesis protein EgtB [Planctomycetaceae bacterium SH139]
MSRSAASFGTARSAAVATDEPVLLADGYSVPRLPTPTQALQSFHQVRQFSKQLTRSLEPEDCVIQSMPDASPIRWHLAHTTWFFETFVLRPADPSYRPPNEQFAVLFNSYYNAVGDQFPRDQRGLLSRPTMRDVWDYRRHVEAAIEAWLHQVCEQDWQPLAEVFQIGIQHEQQHQELMLTDIKHLFSRNPLAPAVFNSAFAAGDFATTPLPSPTSRPSPMSSAKRSPEFLSHPGGIVEIGHEGPGFCYDNETPRHAVLLQPFQLAVRPVTNGQFLEFIEAGGYRHSEHWLSAGWAVVNAEHWTAPLYWLRREDQWYQFSLHGIQPLNLDESVSHLSYFEADAFARWAGARLPTEAEWEVVAAAAGDAPGAWGQFAEQTAGEHSDAHGDATGPNSSQSTAGPQQLFGGVWEWTASQYVGYPGYRPPPGAIGEYNGKFMCNQFVLRGGSLATPQSHIRPTYRNFFPPDARWQFSGLRLAR